MLAKARVQRTQRDLSERVDPVRKPLPVERIPPTTAHLDAVVPPRGLVVAPALDQCAIPPQIVLVEEPAEHRAHLDIAPRREPRARVRNRRVTPRVRHRLRHEPCPRAVLAASLVGADPRHAQLRGDRHRGHEVGGRRHLDDLVGVIGRDREARGLVLGEPRAPRCDQRVEAHATRIARMARDHVRPLGRDRLDPWQQRRGVIAAVDQVRQRLSRERSAFASRVLQGDADRGPPIGARAHELLHPSPCRCRVDVVADARAGDRPAEIVDSWIRRQHRIAQLARRRERRFDPEVVVRDRRRHASREGIASAVSATRQRNTSAQHVSATRQRNTSAQHVSAARSAFASCRA